MRITGFLLAFVLLMGVRTSAADFEKATDAVRNMGVGWSLGNSLDSHNGSRMTDVARSQTIWGQPPARPELMRMVKEAGFGTMRIPVTWYPHIDNDGKVDSAWMKRVHDVVDYVIDSGMYCILNVHHDTGADSEGIKSWLKADESTYIAQKDRFESLWRQIAMEFRDYGERLLFEGFNEMLDTYSSWCYASYATPAHYDAAVAASAYNAVNSFAQCFVDVVRSTGGNNRQRNLVVNTYGACSGAGNWNPHLQDPLKQMKLPEDRVLGHLIFQVHTYPDISNLENAMAEVNAMFDDLNRYLVAKGAPVMIGEWGTSNFNADYEKNRSDMLSFVRFFVQKAKAEDMTPIFWMSIADRAARSLPAFSHPDLAETLVKAYHGDDFHCVIPKVGDLGRDN
jgi:aryl-phospho-beta-D-glucosidase BglC (GH1 family)